jgi:hypothetical protein
MPIYDALIIDEVQVFQENWVEKLVHWFDGRRIAVFGDDTQAFDFEKPVPVRRLAELIGCFEPFVLTVSIRSPKAVFGHRFKCSFCEQRSVYTFWRKEGLSPAAGRLQYLGDLSKVDKSPARL